MNNFLKHIKDNPLEELKIFSGKFISIGLLVKYSDKFKEYIEDLERNCFDVRNFEVIIIVPDDDEKEHERILNVCDNTEVEVKLVKSPYKYLNSMKSHNTIIDKISDQNTYFYINNSDRCRFSSKNWDLIIKQYINVVPDDMYFLRGSNFSKNIKFRDSAHAAYYSPEQWGVFTRKYLRAVGGFLETHTGHDAPSEMIQYYISKNKKDKFQRDILMPNIMHSDIRTITSKETTGGKSRFYERYYINNFFYKSYFSKKGLELCKKASLRVMLEHIIWSNNYKSAKIIQKSKSLAIILNNNKLLHKHSFKLNIFEYIREKYLYFYGTNHGLNFAHRFYFIIKNEKGFTIMRKIVFFLNSHIQNTKNHSKIRPYLFVSYIFYLISSFFTFIFITEPVSNELEGLFRGDDFKKVLHGNVIKDAYKSKLYNKSLQQIADDLEKS